MLRRSRGLGLVVGRVVAGRVLHQAGQHGRLVQLELGGRLGEVVPGGGLDAVGAVAEVGDVEVALEDPVLGVLLLEGDGVAQLADLALVGVRGGRGLLLLGVGLVDQRQLDHLLGDRRAALDDPVGRLVGDERAQRALQVERAVLVEAVVLDRDDRLAHDRRDLVERDVDPVLVVERGQRRPSWTTSRVRCGSGSASRSAGSLSMLSATSRAPKPATPANGMARPATSTPITAATATMTPRWDRMLAGWSLSVRRADMVPGYGTVRRPGPL